MSRALELSRRDYLSLLASVAGATLLSPKPAQARARRVGLQLVTIREALDQNFQAALSRVADLGISEVEPVWWLFGPDKPAADLKRGLTNAGLSAPSSHVRAAALTTEWQKRLSDAHVLGHGDLVCVTIPAEQRRTLDDWRRWADVFNTAAEQAREAGIALSFHAHAYDFDPVDGQVPYDIFLERTSDAVGIQMDVSHYVRAGRSPEQYLQRWARRIRSFHIRDLAALPSNDTVVVGTGRVPYRSLLRGVPALASKPLFIEQTIPNAEPFDGVRQSRDGLNRILA